MRQWIRDFGASYLPFDLNEVRLGGIQTIAIQAVFGSVLHLLVELADSKLDMQS